MMTIHEVRKSLQCSRATAEAALKHANVSKTVVRFAHGRKHFYDVDPGRLPEIMANYKKDPAQIAEQKMTAFSALEMAFGMRGGQNAVNR